MGDDFLRHCKGGGRLRKDAAAQKGHAYPNAHNLRISSDISSNSRTNLEENQFAPYFMENHKRGPNPNQTVLKKLESGKPSPSIIAKLMGLKELPTEKGLEKYNNKSGGAFHKKSLSGLSSNRYVEFKDVFEVIEERNQQQGKGQNRKDFVKHEAFEGDFENYKGSFVKSIEKSNPLFAKHLLDLKCYPPHLHKSMVSRLKLGYFNEHVSTENLKSRNSGKRDNYIPEDHIVLLDPKMGNFEQDTEFERAAHQNFLENLENRRGKAWRFENIGRQGNEYCNNRNILKLEKLRRFDSNLSNKGTKSLAEVLATPDLEKSEKHIDSHNYRRKVSKSKCGREAYYEKVEGSFANLPQDVSPSLLEREDVVRLKARKHKLRENLTLRGNFASRFSEKEVCMEGRDLRGESGNNFEIEERMVFTVEEGKNAGLASTQIFTEEAKKYGNEKLRVTVEEKEEFSSVMNFERTRNSKEAEIPSPISVLEPTPIELESSSSSFLKPDSDLHENDMQISEEIEVGISSDDDYDNDDQDITCNDNKNCTLNLLRDQEEREFSYLLDMLIQSGVHGARPDTFRKACRSRDFPVDPRVFDRLERRYGQMLTWPKSDRRMLFDLVNSVLAMVLAPCLDAHPWVRCNGNVGPAWGPEGLVERVWLVLNREREKVAAPGNVEEKKGLDLNWLENLGDDINVIGKQIERMLTDEILEETVLGFILTDR